jgi:hypothetical protein
MSRFILSLSHSQAEGARRQACSLIRQTASLAASAPLEIVR